MKERYKELPKHMLLTLRRAKLSIPKILRQLFKCGTLLNNSTVK